MAISYQQAYWWVFIAKDITKKIWWLKNFWDIDTPPVLERSISAATKLKSELPTDLQMESIPLKELSSLVDDIHIKTREASQNTDLDMWEFLGIDNALQSIQDEHLNTPQN